MTIDYAALKTDILSGPLVSACGSYVSTNADQPIADLYNSRTGTGSATISLPSISKNDFLLGILAPAAMVLSAKDSNAKDKWDRLIGIAISANSFDVESTILQTLFEQAISDGILSQNQIDNVIKRPGSRAEVLFGADTLLFNVDISTALRG